MIFFEISKNAILGYKVHSELWRGDRMDEMGLVSEE